MTPYYKDLPVSEDRLNFGRVVHQLVRDLRNRSLRPPLTVGVQGHWGQGKSSVLAMLEAQASQDKKVTANYLFHAFSPWRYQKEKHLLIPLLLSLAEKYPELEIMESVRRVCLALVHLAGDVFLAASTNKILDMEKVGKALRIYKPAKKLGLFQAEESLSEFVKCRNTLLEVFQTITCYGNKTLVILVDDLDRCHPPEVAVELLEQIHLFFAQEKMPVIFVLAIDPQALREILSRRFTADKAQLYLEKFIQLPIHLPRSVPSLVAHRIGLEELTRHEYYERLQGDPALVNMLERLALHVYPKPRQMKRFLNQVLFMTCGGCKNHVHAECPSCDCHGKKAQSTELLLRIRWLVYKDQAPALADDPVQLRGVEQEIREGAVRQGDLASFLAPLVGATAEDLAAFLLATREHAITDLQALQRCIYSSPLSPDDEAYRHYGMRESMERAYREGRLRGQLGLLEDLDLHHIHIPGGNLSKSTLVGCKLFHGNLSDVDFTDTALAHCTFHQTVLAGARIKAESEPRLILSDCEFLGVDLDNLQCKKVEFQRCIFMECKITPITLDAVEFINCTFQECTIHADGIVLAGSREDNRKTLRSLLQAMKHNRDRGITAGQPSFADVIELLEQKYSGLLP